MKGTLIEAVQEWQGGPLDAGSYILLVEPRRVPPHLALIEGGHYYSLSVKGVEKGKNAYRTLEALQRKGKAFLLIRFQAPANAPSPYEAFEAYEGTGPPQISCLPPLLDRCAVPQDRGCDTVHELIASLSERELLHPPHLAKKLDPFPEGGEMRIPFYRREDVFAHLERFQNAQDDR